MNKGQQRGRAPLGSAAVQKDPYNKRRTAQEVTT